MIAATACWERWEEERRQIPVSRLAETRLCVRACVIVCRSTAPCWLGFSRSPYVCYKNVRVWCPHHGKTRDRTRAVSWPGGIVGLDYPGWTLAAVDRLSRSLRRLWGRFGSSEAQR